MSLKDFAIMRKLGQGSYATVYQARRLTDQKLYALKQIDVSRLDSKSKQNALNQIRFLASFNCSNIIKYYEAFFEQQLNLLCIVMQFAEGGDLAHLIQAKKDKKEKFYELQIWKALIGLIHGLGYLHQRSILHRDIKPQNIFIHNGNFKIGDLNVSRLAEQNRNQNLTQIGTPYYASPQIWENCPYDTKSDVWSLGCVIYQMATLQPPFLAKSMDKLYEQITTGKVKPIPKHYSNQLEAIITKCLSKETSKRPTVKELQENFTVQMYYNLYYSAQLELDRQKSTPLLKTITMAKGKGMAQVKLPQPNYEQEKSNKDSSQLQSETKPKTEAKVEKITNQNVFEDNWIKMPPPSISSVKQLAERLNPNNSSVQQVKMIQGGSQKELKRRSLPRTELSAKKLQTVEQSNNKIERSQPAKGKVSEYSLLNQNDENAFDYKKALYSKLSNKMNSVSINQAEVKGLKQKKSIIQDLVSRQQDYAQKIRQKQNSVVGRQGRYRPQIFVNPEIENVPSRNHISIGKRIRSVQCSLNL